MIKRLHPIKDLFNLVELNIKEIIKSMIIQQMGCKKKSRILDSTKNIVTLSKYNSL